MTTGAQERGEGKGKDVNSGGGSSKGEEATAVTSVATPDGLVGGALCKAIQIVLPTGATNPLQGWQSGVAVLELLRRMC